MSVNAEDNLERELANLTRWEGGDVDAWRAALAAERATKTQSSNRFASLARLRVAGWMLTGIAAAIVLVFVIPLLHSLGSGVQSRWQDVRSPALSVTKELARKPADAQAAGAGFAGEGYGSRGSGVDSFGRAGPGGYGGGAEPAELRGRIGAEGGYFGTASVGDGADAARNMQVGPAAEAKSTRESAPADRHVIRKATIELRSADVRAAFLKAAHLVSEARGEYVQESSLTGSEQRLEANLTLRVAAERLSAVLQALRELGTVRTETAGGEDVTTQVVDLEARLKNEQRVEAELLQLMEKRTDAPLKEVLEVRAAIGHVRQTIETITAQRERLGRLVSLATVLVIIRPADAAEPTPPGLWDYFTTAISRAAERGLHALINTVAGFILVLIGGALWIVLLAIGAVLLFRRFRAATRTV